MSTLQELLETNEAEKLAALKTAAPKGWERGNERIGDYGVGSTGPIEPGTTVSEQLLLERAGFDPEEWQIVGDVNYREWDANIGGGVIKTMQYRKFNVKRRNHAGKDIEELIKSVNRRKRTPSPGSGAATHVFASGDWQLGKIDGDGTEGSVDRVLAGIDQSVRMLKQSRKRDVGFAHIAFMADCGEYFVSQGGKNIWRTDLTVTETHRLVRRLMLYAIDEHAPYVDRLTVVAVPGNHDQAIRQPGITTYDDSFDVDALIAVTDAMTLNPAVYGHVETYVPKRDSKLVTMDVNGTNIMHLHGEDVRPGKHWDWWKGQAFEPGVDPAQADIMLFAHGHHFMVDTKGSRTAIMTPATESESTWWKNKTGDHGAPGSLVFTAEGGKPRGLTIVGSL